MNSEQPTPEQSVCRHDPFQKNDLIVEAHWAAGVRIRCKKCGMASYVGQRGRVRPDPKICAKLEAHAND